jgi:hypothetical protein
MVTTAPTPARCQRWGPDHDAAAIRLPRTRSLPCLRRGPHPVQAVVTRGTSGSPPRSRGGRQGAIRVPTPFKGWLPGGRRGPHPVQAVVAIVASRSDPGPARGHAAHTASHGESPRGSVICINPAFRRDAVRPYGTQALEEVSAGLHFPSRRHHGASGPVRCRGAAGNASKSMTFTRGPAQPRPRDHPGTARDAPAGDARGAPGKPFALVQRTRGRDAAEDACGSRAGSVHQSKESSTWN